MYCTSRWSRRARAKLHPDLRAPAAHLDVLELDDLVQVAVELDRHAALYLTGRDHSSGVLEKPLQGFQVARHSFTDHLVRRDVRQIRMVPERLALADVADVHLDDRERAPGDGIAQDDRGVGEPAGIDDGTIRVGVLLQEVDERALVVGLEVRDGMSGAGKVAAPLDHLGEGRRPVDRGLTRSQRVEVRTIQQEQLHGPSTIAAA